MKRTMKYKSELTEDEIPFTVSEKLNRLKGNVQAPKELAAANELLRKLKTPLSK
jgi:hypothetical protein